MRAMTFRFPPRQRAALAITERPDSSVVERGPEKAGVGGSIPSLATIIFNYLAKSLQKPDPLSTRDWFLLTVFSSTPDRTADTPWVHGFLEREDVHRRFPSPMG